jgi:uncharacterized RDD family membrane protein YckC
MADERQRASDRRPAHFVEPAFGQRLLARLVDTLVALPLVGIAGIVPAGRGRVAVGLLLVAVYEITFVMKRGQTLGKILMGTRIVDRDTGELPDARQAIVRWLTVVAASLISFVIPAFDSPITPIYTLLVFVPIMRSPLHLGLHDLAAGTIVTSTADNDAARA